MTTTTFTSARGVRTSPPVGAIATRATRHRLVTAARAVRVFAGAALGVVVLGEYADGQ